MIEPTAKGMLAGRRLARLAARPDGPKNIVAVANKVRDAEDTEVVAGRIGLPLIASVPHDETFAEAERQGLAPIDYAADSPAVRAVESLVSQLSEERQP